MPTNSITQIKKLRKRVKDLERVEARLRGKLEAVADDYVDAGHIPIDDFCLPDIPYDSSRCNTVRRKPRYCRRECWQKWIDS